MMRALFISLLFLTGLKADVKGTNDQIKFDIQSDNQEEMILNETGLGIGITPSANLHVNGNAIIPQQLFVGSNSGSSNLNINGTLGLGFLSISSNQLVTNNSMVIVDSQTAGANLDLQLGNSANQQGIIHQIKNTGSTYSVRLTHNEGLFDTLYPSITLESYGSIKLIPQGNSYYILSTQGSVNTTQYELNEISNCVLWLDASDSTTITVDGSGNVTTWLDKSDQGYTFSDSGGDGSHPSITTNWKNNLNAMAFDPNTQEYLRSSTDLVYSDSEYTMFIVFDNNTASADSNASVLTIDGTGNPSLWFATRSNGQMRVSNQHTSSFSATSAVAGALNTSYRATSWFSQSLESKFISISGFSSSTTTSASDSDIANPLVNSVQDAWVGCQKIGSGSAPEYRSFGGNVGEILFYSRLLNSDEITAVETYLDDKWGI